MRRIGHIMSNHKGHIMSNHKNETIFPLRHIAMKNVFTDQGLLRNQHFPHQVNQSINQTRASETRRKSNGLQGRSGHIQM